MMSKWNFDKPELSAQTIALSVAASAVSVLVVRSLRRDRKKIASGVQHHLKPDGSISNWFGNETWKPLRLEHPTNLAELQKIIQNAGEKGERVRAVGALHSWSNTAEIDGGVMVGTELLNRVLEVDVEKRTITAESGIRLEDLYIELKKHRLALPSLPNTDKLRLGGIIGNSAHGTNRTVGTMSSLVQELVLVTANGEALKLRASATASPERERFDAAIASMGHLGVIYSITLQCVPEYNSICHEVFLPKASVEGKVKELMLSHDSLFLYVHPSLDLAMAKVQAFISPTISKAMDRKTMTDFLTECWIYSTKPGKKKVWKYFVGSVISMLVRYFPGLHRSVSGVVHVVQWDDGEIVVKSWKDRAFLNCEYAIPLENIDEACAAIVARGDEFRAKGTYDRHMGWAMRAVAGDSRGFLSPALSKVPIVYFDIPYQSMNEHEFEFFRHLEADLIGLGGRVSWARRFNCTAEQVLANYPEAAQFAAVIKDLDPKGMFSNKMRMFLFGQ